MPKADKHQPQEQVKLSGRLSEFREALQDEINEIENNGQNSTLLVGGHNIESKGDGFWYRFLVEYMPLLPADTPCKLIVGTEEYDVTVISSNENEIILSSKNKLPANIGKARLENGSTVLMERLIKCIEENAKKENPAGERMFIKEDGNVYPAKHLFTYDVSKYTNYNDGQRNAVKSALENDITYIWGPPGTGKTTVISAIINELFEHERSVLIVSHTNTAVDGAIIKVNNSYMESHKDSQAAYPILRLGITAEGFPHDALLDAHVERLGKDLYEKKELLEKRQVEIRELIEEIKIVLVKNTWLEESNLPELQGICEILDQLQQEKTIQEKQQSKANEELEKIIQANPDKVPLIQLKADIHDKQNALTKIRDESTSLREQKGKRENERRNAEDEIKKYIFYDELTLKIRHFMSEQFYKEKISKTEGEIKTLERTLQGLREKKKDLQVAISKFESKGSVAKFFSGKASYELDQKSLLETNHSIDINTKELLKKESLLVDYQKQLSDLQLLQEKRQAVKPTNSKMYWTDEERRLRKTISELETKLTVLSEQEKQLSSQILSLEATKRDNQAFFDSIAIYQGKSHSCQQRIEDIIKQIAQNSLTLTELLDEECEICASFHDFTGSDDLEVIRELTALNDEIFEELHNVDIEEEKKQKESYDEELTQILTELSKIQNQMAELEKQAIMNAGIIGTTLAKSYLSEMLRERQFDTVILDEASMASIPALWCAAYLAEKNIVIVGDFLQLPPIVMAKTEMAQKWLGRDVFDHSGIQDIARKENTGIRPVNFAILYEQYRMEEDIAKIANIYYGEYTELKSYDMFDDRVEARKKFYSWYSGKWTKAPIHLIDTESLHAWVTGIPQAKGHSRLNAFSAAVDVALAFKCLENFIENRLYESEDQKGTKVLIIAPYKPHVTLLNKLIENEYQNRGISPEYALVRAGTIHSFQGSEADIVIFDLVIDEPHYKVGLFMSDPDINANARKMFNVAVTRAKFKLFVVGDFKYCQSRAKNNALGELLSNLTARYKKVDTKNSLLPNMLSLQSNDAMLAGKIDAESVFLNESKFHDFFLSDIQAFRHNMIIYSPFMTENRISILLPAFYAAISQGKRIVVITKPLSERGKTELPHYKQCEKGLQNIGVSILHKKGMHEKTILVDDDVIWTGSLNALSYTGNTGEVMERRKDTSKDKTIISSYIKILDIEYLVKALDNDYETKCPICGGEMLIAESENGGIYWRCTNGDYTRNKDQQYPMDGVLRCAKCDSPFVFSMKNKPRWVCKADSKHYQYLRKNDLKLPQMASLLSDEDKKRVHEYFEKMKE